MDTVKVEKGNVKMIAHRGASGLERENTAAAFVAAGQRSYYGVETDVHITADGKFIIVHDDDLKRVAGLRLEVEKSAFATLRAVRMKDIDGKTRREDLCLPTPEEYLSVCKKYGKQAVLEIKNLMPKEKIRELVKVVKTSGWYGRTTFISFARENLVRLREVAPAADAQFLAKECGEKEIEFMVENRLDADLYFGCLSAELVKRLHKAGLKVNTWTVDDPRKMETLVSYGVDFVTSNILE